MTTCFGFSVQQRISNKQKEEFPFVLPAVLHYWKNKDYLGADHLVPRGAMGILSQETFSFQY